ncbi:MAG TPA: TetR family transcriptional regulator [Polyangiaceae bacterium]|nr:TetR family transcriptional regulator [Polyangiaceae bacterium]
MNGDSDLEPARQSLRERLREATSREILAAAEQVFSEMGLERAAMAQIAERAGVAVGTLYNRFTDREALLDALLSERRAELLDKVDAQIAALSRASFRERLEGFFLVLFKHFQDHRAFLRLVFASEVGKREKREEMSRALFQRVERLFEQGRRERALRKDPDQALPVFLMAAAKGMLQREVYGLPALEPDRAAKSLVKLFLEGAGP